MYKIVPSKEMKNVFDLVDSFFDLSEDRTFKLDVKEDDNKYTVIAEMPGVDKNNIKIDYHNDVLDISFKEEKEEEKKEEGYIHKERYFTSGQRRIHLENVDPDNIKAKLENGLLEVEAYKQQEKSKRIITIE